MRLSNTLKKWVKPLKNKFIIITLFFIAWMLFIDSNSWFIHKELNKEIQTLKEKKKYYKEQLRNDTLEIKKLKTHEGIEAYAREHYYMKKENEEIYIIEYEDSLKTKNNNE